MLFLLVLILFCGGGWLIGDLIGKLLFSKKETYKNEPNITIHNYTTENHLHISPENLETFNKSKS